ncbi:hypothetical protein PENSPDRAFT_649343 [Peniophora sp. CONT]|nr:hypothetical protein PENSPDRAFT_649343 [Peniophora sp. CONT]
MIGISQHETQPLLDKKTDDYNTDVKDSPPPGYSFTSSDDDAVSNPASAVNGLSISVHLHNEITGSYELDPALPTNGRGTGANFKSHHGNITTKLAVTGTANTPNIGRNYATIRATSETGDILIDVTEMSSRRCLDVETWTRRGNTILLLPPNFLGVVGLKTSRGRLIQLPGLEGRTSITWRPSGWKLSFLGREWTFYPREWTSFRRESSFLVGPVFESVSMDVKGISCVRLSSKKGGIAVGFSGVDGEPQMLENVRKDLSARRGFGRGCC